MVDWCLQPVEKRLPGGESEGANDHPQASATDDFLELLSDGFQRGRIVATSRAPEYSMFCAVTALGGEANVVCGDTSGLFHSRDEVPDRPGVIELCLLIPAGRNRRV